MSYLSFITSFCKNAKGLSKKNYPGIAMKHLAQVYCCGVVMGTLHYFGSFNYLLLTIKSSAEISDTEITFLRKRLSALQNKQKTCKRISSFVTENSPSLPNLKNTLMTTWHLIVNLQCSEKCCKSPITNLDQWESCLAGSYF